MRRHVKTEEAIRGMVGYASENVFEPSKALVEQLDSIKLTMEREGEACPEQIKGLRDSWESIGGSTIYLSHCGLYFEKVQKFLRPYLSGSFRFQDIEDEGTFTLADHEYLVSLVPDLLQCINSIEQEARDGGYL